MSFDNNSFYDDNSTKNWQPQPTPMEDRRRRHTGKWITVIVIVGMLSPPILYLLLRQHRTIPA